MGVSLTLMTRLRDGLRDTQDASFVVVDFAAYVLFAHNLAGFIVGAGQSKPSNVLFCIFWTNQFIRGLLSAFLLDLWLFGRLPGFGGGNCADHNSTITGSGVVFGLFDHPATSCGECGRVRVV